jgi:hypothetical protein
MKKLFLAHKPPSIRSPSSEKDVEIGASDYSLSAAVMGAWFVLIALVNIFGFSAIN